MLDHLKIGPIIFQLEPVNDLVYVPDEGKPYSVYGVLDMERVVIKYDPENSPDMQLATLWHEAIHVILNIAGHEEHPEGPVVALGYGLLALVRENPELVYATPGVNNGIQNQEG